MNEAVTGREPGGILALFAQHPTAPNLLMIIMLALGLLSMQKLHTQFFPDIKIEAISITVQWPGASAEDVDLNVITALEREVSLLDGVDEVTTAAYTGTGTVAISFHSGADMQKALSDVQSAVSLVTTLSQDSEQPVIRRMQRYDTVSRLLLSGPYPEAALRHIARRMRDELLARGVDKVELTGMRRPEIAIEVDTAMLERLNLDISTISDRIREATLDLPAGTLESQHGQHRVRGIGRQETVRELEDIEILNLGIDASVLLREVASVSQQFEDHRPALSRNGHRAIELDVQQPIGADLVLSSKIVNQWLAESRATLPPQLRLEQYNHSAALVDERISILLKNGVSGLALVLAILFVFLNVRVALWVAVGIPVAIMAAMAVMWATGQTINMLSLFGLIMVLGIVVDDAIVVGEHAYALHEAGESPLTASLQSAKRMWPPVFGSSMTTIAAFAPLFLISGAIGDVIVGIPLVMLAVIIASLIECFLVLPGHLREAFSHSQQTRFTRLQGLRQHIDSGLAQFRDGPFRRWVILCVEWRYATLATAIALLIVVLGLVSGGIIRFHFFSGPEVDRIYANVSLHAGATRADTELVLDELERALYVSVEQLDGNADELLTMVVSTLGATVSGGGMRSQGEADNVGGIVVELISADRRSIRNKALITAWRQQFRRDSSLESLSIAPMQAGPQGKDVDVRLLGDDLHQLKAAAAEVKNMLRRISGVSDIADDLPYGDPEILVELTPRGRALGLTAESVGRQLRSGLQGRIAKRFARGDDEVWIRVSVSDPDYHSSDGSHFFNRFFVRTPAGSRVPLSQVSMLRESAGFSRIPRRNGLRQIAIQGEINKRITSTGEVIESLKQQGLKKIADKYDLQLHFGGTAEKQSTTFSEMLLGAALGLSGIYIVLAWVFASYIRPLLMMLLIPLGLIGTILGHWALGFDLTNMSLVALIGLSGIVINDAIVLVNAIDHHSRKKRLYDAIVDGACDRMRAVMLTSATTIGGLTPLLLETSFQAKFLQPMAVTIVGGLAVATVLVLLVVPALIAIHGDLVGRTE